MIPKFRAWDKDRKEFLSAGMVLLSIHHGKNPINKLWLDVLKYPDIYKDRFDIQQFIGRKDKNNIELYHGDLLMLNNKNYDPEENYYEGMVEVVAETCGYRLKPIPDLEEFNQFDSSMFWHFCKEDTTEKIGTIYENPELLK